MNKPEYSVLDDKTPAMGSMPAVISVIESELDVNNIFDNISIHLVSNNHNKTFEISRFPYVIGGKGHERDVNKKIVSIDKKNNSLIIDNKGGEGYLKVNNHPVQSVILQDGDELLIGNELFLFKVEKKDINIEKKPETDNSIDIVDRAMLVKQAIIAEKGAKKTATDNMHVLDENEPDHNKKNKKRKVFFAVFTVLLTSIGIVAYKSYITYMGESRVFHISENTNNKATSNNKDNKVIVESKANGKTTAALLLPGKSVKTTDRKKQDRPRHTLKIKKYNIKQTGRIKKSREKILYELEYSEKMLADAKKQYLAGRYNKSIQILDNIISSKRYRADYRVISGDLKNELVRLYGYYQNGNRAYEKGDKDKAFIHWTKLLKQHKKYFAQKESFYTKKINDIVATEYEMRGNKAYADDEWGDAYHNWANSIAIRPKTSIQRSISLMDAELKELYRTGYRYETVNIDRALEYWKALLKKAPRDHEYYIKAAAKIKWYEYTR